jgi:hypothetical protein
VLTELIGQSAITVERSRLVVLAPTPRLDELGFEVVAQIAAEPGLTPSETIDGLAPSIRDRVARRLIKNGGADQRRVGLRRRRVAVARDGDIEPAWVARQPGERSTGACRSPSRSAFCCTWSGTAS